MLGIVEDVGLALDVEVGHRRGFLSVEDRLW
jgi:hypothetical protein